MVVKLLLLVHAVLPPIRPISTMPLSYKEQLVSVFNEIIAVYSEKHVNLVNSLCDQNTKLLIVKAGGTYSCHWVLKG
jgi:hypothetical protein